MGNEIRQKFVIEEIAKVDNVLDGVKKIQASLSNLKVPDDFSKQFETIIKRMEQQAEKAKKAASSGFDTKASVKSFTEALDSISRLYTNIIDKAEDLKKDNNLSLNMNTTDLEKSNKLLEQFETDLKAAKKAADTAKASAQRVFTGVANAYSRNKNPFAEWGEAARKFAAGDIKGVKEELDKLEQKFQGKDTSKNYWKAKVESYEKLKTALEQYEAAQKNATLAQQARDKQEQISKGYVEAARQELEKSMQVMGQVATEATNMADSEGRAARETQQLNSELEHFKNKAAYFFGLNNAIHLFRRALRSAYNTVKDLDAVMTETAVVTNFDVGDMWSQLPEYTKRANELGVSIHSAYEAATIFYQQGLKTNEVMAVSNETLKMARIAGLDAATASDRMTNALRGFNMEMDKVSAQRVNDVYSKLAAITASNTDEISTAMTKVASLAHNANMEFETTSAFLAQMIETTRESAETAGTALKTVVARFSEVKKLYSKGELMGQDEEGGEIDVNKVSTALRSAGIDLNEYLTGAKGLDDIFIELASKWDSLDKVQQRYIATMAAGSRQQSRFIAMMSDYSRTMELVDAANNANGASQEQYAKTLESLQTKLSRLKNAWDEFILGLANSDVIKGAVDALTDLITAINTLIKKVSNKNAIAKMVTSFFTAFTAFKIGQKAFGGTQIAKFFSGLTQTAGAEGKKGAVAFVGNFYQNLGTKIREAKPGEALKRGLGSAKNFWGGLSDYFNPKQIVGISGNLTKDDVLTNMVHKYGGTMSTPQIQSFRGIVGSELENGTLTLDKLNKALADNGVKTKVSAREAEKFGLVMGDNNGTIESGTAGLRRFSALAIIAGGAMIGFSSALENSDGPLRSLAPLLKYAGIAVMTFGTIMSVWLPLQAQIGATKLSATIFGIPIIGWIAAAISAVLALGAAFLSWKKSTSFETRMKNATEACKNAAEAADEATKAYEKLGQAWESLNDKYAAIDNAVAGTQQWRDAIKDANNEVLSLIETYKDLDVEVGADGRLKITEESKKAVENNLAEKRDNAQAASLGAQLNRNRLDAEHTQAKKDSWSLTGMGANTWKIGDTEYNEEKVKQIAIDEYNKGQIKSTEDLQALVHKYMPSSAIGLPVFDKIRDYEFNALKDYAKDKDFSESSRPQFTAMASNALTSMNNQDAVKYAKNIVNGKAAEEIFNEELKKYEGNEFSIKQKRQMFAENLNYNSYDEWKKDNGDKDIDEASLNYQLASQEAQAKVKNYASQFEGRMGTLTKEQLKFFEQDGGAALSAKNIKEIRDAGGIRAIVDKIGDADYFKSINIDREEYIRQLEEQLNKAGDYVTVKTTSILNGLGDNITNSLTAGVGKGLEEKFNALFISSGQEGVDEVTKRIKDLTKDMKPEQVEAFTKELNALDWTSVDSVHALSDLAEEYNLSEKDVKELESQIIKFNNATKKVDLTKITDQFKSILGIGKKIQTGAQGRNFTEEQVKQLTEAGVDESKFVYNIETGQYNYTGVLDDILNSIQQLIKNTFDTKQLEKDIASGTVAKELFSSKGDIENQKDKSSFVLEYIQKAGENGKIDSMAWSQAYDKARNGDYTDMNQLYEIVKQERDNLSTNEAKLNDYKFKADVMNAQMNSGAENAARANGGDKAALEALKAQFSNSNFSEEIKKEILAGINSGDEKSINQAGSLVDTSTQANALGINSEELDAYAKALQHVEGLQDAEIDELYRLSLAELNYQKGQQAVYDSYDSWSKLIQKNGGIIPDGSLEQGKVFAQLNKDLKQMLNLSEDLPDDFLAAAGRADELKKAMKGNKDAIAKLRAEAAKVTFKNFNLSIKKDDTTKIENQIDKLAKEMPDLKLGTTLDSTKFGPALMEMVNKAGMSVDQIQKLFNGLGWAPEITWKKATVEDVKKTAQNGVIKQPDPNNPGKTIDVKLDGFDEWATTNDVFIPQVGGKTSYIAPKPPKTPNPKPKSKGKKGGGGKKSKAKKERWENPYDELYNLQEKINEALRKREALERRYQKLLKQQQTSLKDIRAAYYDQIKQMRTEASLQRELAAGRLRQIENIGKETYVKSNGKVTTFEKMGVLKYASWDKNTGELQIDWDAIQKLEGTKHVETGKAVVEYISKLEELTKSYEETRDTLWDIEDKIEDLRQEVIDSYMSFEERVMEAVVNRYQKQIDNYQAMSDAIDKVNNEVLKSLREQVDLSRQIRDNTKKEEDISKKENRLAYLRRDTSGANDLEILSLEKELKEAREGYSDDLVDQAIDKMQDDADKASEQRTRQIETMQAQLDIAKETGALWKEVWGLMNEAAAGDGALSPYSNLVNLLKETEAFQSLSEIGKSDWFQKVTEEYLKAQTGKNEAEDKFKVDANGDGVVKNTNTQNTINEVAGETKTYKKLTPRELNGIALAAAVGGYGWSKEFKQLKAQLKGKNILPAQITSIINKVNELIRVSAGQLKNNNWKNLAIARKNKITNLKPYAMSKFKTGGLADKTGPAWLDGTKTNPELVLNAQDTRNFIALKDILASLMNTQKTGNKTSTGNNYFDIDIHADIGSDYDVDKLANRLKKIIFEDGQYRNVNTINLLR